MVASIQARADGAGLIGSAGPLTTKAVSLGGWEEVPLTSRGLLAEAGLEAASPPNGARALFVRARIIRVARALIVITLAPSRA